MAKVINTFIEKEQSLLQLVSEAGFLDRAKAGLSKKETPPVSNNPSRAEADPEVKAQSPLENVISEIVSVPAGEWRFIIHMSLDDLTKYYLKRDHADRIKLVQHLMTESKKWSILKFLNEADDTSSEDDALKAKAQGLRDKLQAKRTEKQTGVAPTKPAAKTAPEKENKPEEKPGDEKPKPDDDEQSVKSIVTILKPGYKFSDLYKQAGNHECSVLLNVPDSLKREYDAAQDKKQVLEKILDHKYYVMTISNGKARKIGDAVDAAKDFDGKLDTISPYIVVNYPGAQTIKQAKDKWNSDYKDKQPEQAAPSSDTTSSDTDNHADAEGKLAASALASKNTAASADTQTTSPTDASPANTEPPASSAAASSPPEVDNVAQEKLEAIKKLYAEYEKLVSEKHADRLALDAILKSIGALLK
jgi:hypothetical protein